jgi:hypothetical protein
MDQLVDQIKSILADTPEAQASSDLNQTGEQSAGKSNHAKQGDAKGILDDLWNPFKSALERATVPVGELISDFGQMFQRKTFNEPLHRCTDQAWLARYDGARHTREKLLQQSHQVKAACAPHERELFDLLLTELDGYAMALQGLLLKPAEFKLGRAGELEMDESIQNCCEDRRLAIRSIAARLVYPLDDPLTAEAVRFMAAETNEERKMIVHRRESRIRQEWERLHEYETDRRSTMVDTVFEKLVAEMPEPQTRHSDLEAKEKPNSDSPQGRSAPAQKQTSTLPTQKPLSLLQFRESSWDLDRIYYYLLVRYFGTTALRWKPATKANTTEQQTESAHPAATEADRTAKSKDFDLVCAARDIEMEVERYRARSKGGSLIPLTYGLFALKALWEAAARSAEERDAMKSAFAFVREELGELLKSEAGRPIERLLAEIR